MDDLYQIEDILVPSQKEQFQIDLTSSAEIQEDAISLGYLKLSLLK